MNPQRRTLLRATLPAIAAAGTGLLGFTSLAPRAAAQDASNPVAEKVLGEMGKAVTIDEGRGKRVLYIFFDANCPYCHLVYTELRSKVGKDDLQFRWVPCAVLTPTSVTRGAAILQAPNRLAAFQANENGYGKGADPQAGGITPAAKVDPATAAILNANNALLDATKSPGVPTLLWRDKKGHALLLVGPPDAKQLEDILRSVA